MCVIPDIHIIQNDGVFDIAVVSNIGLSEQNGILYHTIDDGSAGNKAVLYTGTYIILGRRQVLCLGIDIRVLLKEVIPDLCFRKSILVSK